MNSKKTLTKRKNVLAAMVGLFAAAGGSSSAMAQGDEAATAQGRIDEIIVTARKRAESLQDVPLSVSAITGLELDKNGIEDANQLYGRVPGLYFSNDGGFSPGSDSYYLTIRGVGFNGGQEPAVGVFIDGVYQPQVGYDISFLDLQQLEVLRGPQGTLFGRNTQGGALNLVTKKPDENFIGNAKLEAAEFGTYRAQVSLRGPLSDSFFGGLSAAYGSSDGYIKNLSNGGDQNFHDKYTISGTLRWLPTDDLEILLTGDISKKDHNEIGFGVPLPCNCYETSEDLVEDEKNISGLAFSLKWDIDESVSLKSITGIRKTDSDINLDTDAAGSGTTPAIIAGIAGTKIPDPITVAGANFNVIFDQQFISQELRLEGSQGDGIDWLVGAYYFDQSEEFKRIWDVGPDVVIEPSLSFFAPLYVRDDLNQDRDGWAFFGQTSWKVNEVVELTLGARYSSESVTPRGESVARIENLDSNLVEVPTEDGTFTSFTSLGSISYRLTEKMMSYVTISQGWKAGGFNKLPTSGAADVSFDEEASTNYEIGLKSEWFDNSLLTSLSVFHVDITDQQLTTVVFVDGVPLSGIANAGESRSHGAELELSSNVNDRLKISLAMGYTDTKFKDYTDGTVVRDGERFPYIPDLTGSLSFDYNIPLSKGADLEVYLNYRHIAEYHVGVAGFAGTNELNIPSQDRIDLQLSLIRQGWRFTGYVSNVFDSYDYNRAELPIYVANTSENLFASPLSPRQAGIKISRDF